MSTTDLTERVGGWEGVRGSGSVGGEREKSGGSVGESEGVGECWGRERRVRGSGGGWEGVRGVGECVGGEKQGSGREVGE